MKPAMFEIIEQADRKKKQKPEMHIYPKSSIEVCTCMYISSSILVWFGGDGGSTVREKCCWAHAENIEIASNSATGL